MIKKSLVPVFFGFILAAIVVSGWNFYKTGQLLHETRAISVLLKIYYEEHNTYPLTKKEALDYIRNKDSNSALIIDPDRFSYFGNTPVRDASSGLLMLAELETKYGVIQFYEDCHRSYKK
jgi:hypothetical protein